MDVVDEILDQQCNSCFRLNCTGCGPHSTRQFQPSGNAAKFEYNIPSCRTCGIELLDLLEQLECIMLRNQNYCIICGHQYKFSNEHLDHFPMHFNSLLTTSINLQCIECTPDANKFILTCHLCPETFKTKESKKKHLHKEHSKDLLYPCSFCDRKFVSPKDVKCHNRKKHTIVTRVYLGPYSCRVCPTPLKFDSEAAKLEHFNVQHIDSETGKFICPVCKQLYANYPKTIEHMTMHKERKFICDLCGKNFIRKTGLQSHVGSVHATSTNFQCEQCPDKKYKNMLALQRHVRAKHSDNPYRYPCEMCDRVFNDHTDRRRHRWTHGGFPKPFVCLVCDKAFHENKQLRLHMKSHKGFETPTNPGNVPNLVEKIVYDGN